MFQKEHGSNTKVYSFCKLNPLTLEVNGHEGISFKGKMGILFTCPRYLNLSFPACPIPLLYSLQGRALSHLNRTPVSGSASREPDLGRRHAGSLQGLGHPTASERKHCFFMYKIQVNKADKNHFTPITHREPPLTF